LQTLFNSMPIIEINKITKEFKLGQLKSLKHTVLDTFNKLRGKEVEKRKPFKALDDVSFTVEPGEVIGIIGQNGAGKSTLLKLIARVSVPTRGTIKVNGSVAPLIEVGAGLIGDLTGRENIYLNGIILGLSRAEIRKKFNDIVEFAELEEFIDTPIKRYSSGMAVRLGFSIATSVDADILIVDEVLAVGDLSFQRKCFDRMEEMIKKKGKTVLIVGHNVRQLERICSRMLLLDKGKILMDGEPTMVCNTYYCNITDKKANDQYERSRGEIIVQVDTGEIDLLDISLFNGDAIIPSDILEMHGSVRIGVRFEVHVDLPSSIIVLGVHTPDFIHVTTTTSVMLPNYPDFEPGAHYFECHLADMLLKPGSYSLSLAFFDQYARMIWYGHNLKNFKVRTNNTDFARLTQKGLIDLPFKWHFFNKVEI
jgi:lipopolysaccharide transport system ATP-binding protein